MMIYLIVFLTLLIIVISFASSRVHKETMSNAKDRVFEIRVLPSHFMKQVEQLALDEMHPIILYSHDIKDCPSSNEYVLCVETPDFEKAKDFALSLVPLDTKWTLSTTI